MQETSVATYRDLEWSFKGAPCLTIDGYRKAESPGWPHKVYVDPVPCYAHDEDLTREYLDRVAYYAPALTPVHVGIMAFEEEGRTNAYATTSDECYHYDHEAKSCPHPPFTGLIVFNGKRIPPHPAMTRYLVAHEYGHLVDYWLTYLRSGGQRNRGGDNVSAVEYFKLRGLTKPKGYGPGTWHLTPGEVFANDFRLICTGIEPEFWPHPGIDRPDGNDVLIDWWNVAIQEIAVASAPLAPENLTVEDEAAA